MVLLRVVTGEGWYYFVADSRRKTQPNFICNKIDNYYDYEKYGLTGCGTNSAGYYYFSFYVIGTLLILNLFVSMLLAVTDEVSKAAHVANENYKIDEIRKLWMEFDPKAKGYINYKKFWKLIGKYIKKFDLSNNYDHVQNKIDIYKVISLPVFECKRENNIFCFRYHDALIALSKMIYLINNEVDFLEVNIFDLPLSKLESKILTITSLRCENITYFSYNYSSISRLATRSKTKS